jgi:uncharacterized protein YuzE
VTWDEGYAILRSKLTVSRRRRGFRTVDDKGSLVFEVSTLLGFRVRVTRAYWELIVSVKHPVMAGREANMAQVKVYYDQAGNTLTVWFGNPQDEYVCEETGDEVVVMKDQAGRVIGFEKLNFAVMAPEPMRVAFETITV